VRVVVLRRLGADFELRHRPFFKNVSDKMCFETPDTPLDKAYFGEKYGDWANVMPRYANGGSMIGRAATARKAYQRFMREIAIPRFDEVGVDQTLVQFLYWEGGYDLELDLAVELFLTMDHVENSEITLVDDLALPRPVFSSNWNQRIPAFIHWNGRKWKSEVESWKVESPARLGTWDGAGVEVRLGNGTSIPYLDMCPEYPKGV
jgi:hypothetical protein